MAKDPYAYHDDFDPGTGERLREAAAEHPGVTALVSLLSSPLALKLGSFALRWARRHPVLAIGVAAGAYVMWNRRQRGLASHDGHAAGGGGARAGSSGDDYDLPGAVHGSVAGTGDATRRRGGQTDATSIASSL